MEIGSTLFEKYICLLGITIYYIVDTIFYNKLPRNKDEDAILVRIISKDKNTIYPISFG